MVHASLELAGKDDFDLQIPLLLSPECCDFRSTSLDNVVLGIEPRVSCVEVKGGQSTLFSF